MLSIKSSQDVRVIYFLELLAFLADLDETLGFQYLA